MPKTPPNTTQDQKQALRGSERLSRPLQESLAHGEALLRVVKASRDYVAAREGVVLDISPTAYFRRLAKAVHALEVLEDTANA